MRRDGIDRKLLEAADEIRITKLTMIGEGKLTISDSQEIREIATLLSGKKEETREYVCTPDSILYRVEFCNTGESLAFFPVDGHFVKLGNDWYWMKEDSLVKKLDTITKDLQLKAHEPCTFG